MWVWADTFTDHFHPGAGHAAIHVLESAGLRVGVIDEDACCGLTWVTTGQLDHARRLMERTVATLHSYVASGVPVLGLEPSCLATLRSDAVELTDDPRAAEVAAGVLTQLAVTVAYAALPTLVVHAVREEETGVANAVNSIARSVGACFAVGIFALSEIHASDAGRLATRRDIAWKRSAISPSRNLRRASPAPPAI